MADFTNGGVSIGPKIRHFRELTVLQCQKDQQIQNIGFLQQSASICLHEEWIGTWEHLFEITENNNLPEYVKATKKENFLISQDSLQSLLTSLLCLYVLLFVNSNFSESLYPFWAKNLLRQEWLSNIYLSL